MLGDIANLAIRGQVVYWSVRLMLLVLVVLFVGSTPALALTARPTTAVKPLPPPTAAVTASPILTHTSAATATTPMDTELTVMLEGVPVDPRAGVTVSCEPTICVKNIQVTLKRTDGIPVARQTISGKLLNTTFSVQPPEVTASTNDQGVASLVVLVPPKGILESLQPPPPFSFRARVNFDGTVSERSSQIEFPVTLACPLESSAPSDALRPLGANLVRVWGFDATAQRFQLYDPAAVPLSDLTALKRGQGYWVNLRTAQPVILGVGTYHLVAGWNLIGWLG